MFEARMQDLHDAGIRPRNMELYLCGTAYAYPKTATAPVYGWSNVPPTPDGANANPPNTVPKPRAVVDPSLVARMVEQCTTRREGQAEVLSPPLPLE